MVSQCDTMFSQLKNLLNPKKNIKLFMFRVVWVHRKNSIWTDAINSQYKIRIQKKPFSRTEVDFGIIDRIVKKIPQNLFRILTEFSLVRISRMTFRTSV